MRKTKKVRYKRYVRIANGNRLREIFQERLFGKGQTFPDLVITSSKVARDLGCWPLLEGK